MDILLVLLITLFALPISMLLTILMIGFVIKKKIKHETEKRVFSINGFAKKLHE